MVRRFTSCIVAAIVFLPLSLQVGIASPRTAAEPAKTPIATTDRIRQLITELDDGKFRIRAAAERELLRIGEPVLELLLAAARDGSIEVRVRARRIVHRIHHPRLARGFQKLAQQTDDAKFDLEEGMWLTSLIANPLLKRQDIDRQLDELAAAVRKRLADDSDTGNKTPPKQLDPRKVVATFRQVLFVEKGFDGNRADYINPDNSLIDKVLETKKGLPILLSHVVVSVAQRLDLPIVGVQIPGRYMAKYHGPSAPKGFPQEDIVIDAFNGGRPISLTEIKKTIPGFNPQIHLKPSPKLLTLQRMLRNLHAHYIGVGEGQKASQVTIYLRILEAIKPVTAKPK